MSLSFSPTRLLVIDIDGLRQDVFHQALGAQMIPNLASLIGGAEAGFGCHIDPVSPAPSITFCAQSTIFTGREPCEHGIPGNQFFDRFGRRTGGIPRFYAFDVGDALAYDDAVLTFSGQTGLLGQTLDPCVPTLYESAGQMGWDSTVAYHMLSRGAGCWIRPGLVDIARLTRGGGLLGMSAEAYDREMLDRVLDHLRAGARPRILTVYFMGLDHVSHHDGPAAQMDYLSRVVDTQVGRLVEQLASLGLLNNLLTAIVSDHGQIEVIPDDRHSLRLSFPFDREMGYLFDALGLDVHDKPREGPDTDAVVASNGGLAHVYLRHRYENWEDAPRFDEDVLTVARAFWDAHATGRYAPDLTGALAMVLVRSTERDGWQAAYQALAPDGRLLPVEDFLAEHPEIKTVDAPARLRQLAGPSAGDLLLVSNYAGGFYFGGPTTGVHGGLHPDDSLAVASLGWLGVSGKQRSALRTVVEGLVADRMATGGRSRASLADLAPVLERLLFAG